MAELLEFSSVLHPPKARLVRPLLGDWLVEKGAITQEQRDSALAIQRTHGGRLGTILTHNGALPVLALHQMLATQHDMAFVTLLDTATGASLLKAEHLEEYLRLRYVPYMEYGDTLVLATTDPHASVAPPAYAHRVVRYVMTSALDIDWSIAQHLGEHVSEEARHNLRNHLPHYALTAPRTASRFPVPLRLQSALLLCVLSYFLISALQTTITALLVMGGVFFLGCLLFKCLLFVTGMRCQKSVRAIADNAPPVADAHLPVYTILVPLFHEAASVQGLIASLHALDYPPHLLDIKLIVEACDTNTLQAIKQVRPPAQFHIIVVPHSQPQTKPKACNYALRFAKGTYVTIYDAEDMPDPQQLRRCAAVFAAYPHIACVQARLNYYNHDECILTRLFSLEYSCLFDYLLPALYRLRIPIPLGGTSNHLRREVLEKLHAWDAYNVTEDADLGIRLALEGYSILPITSLTQEEAPITATAWIKQRSRWIKGYLQSWAVLSRASHARWRRLGTVGFWGIHFFIGASSLSYLLAPLLWLGCIVWWLAAPVAFDLPLWLKLGCLGILTAGIIVQLLLSVLIHQQRGSPYGVVTLMLTPCYYMLHSIAALRALWQLCTRPYYWDKTTHGNTGMTRQHHGGNMRA